MPRKPGAPKLDGVNYHLIVLSENFDYVYQYYRDNGLRSLAQAFNQIITEHRQKSGKKSGTGIAPQRKISVQ